ncbi:hypothetical protein GCM10010493_78450 [Streptomyces lavendulae subsp. grasserius]
MRVLRLAKESAVKARTQAINQLKAVLLVLDPALREQLASLRNPALITASAGLEDDLSEAASRCACLPVGSRTSPRKSRS